MVSDFALSNVQRRARNVRVLGPVTCSKGEVLLRLYLPAENASFRHVTMDGYRSNLSRFGTRLLTASLLLLAPASGTTNPYDCWYRDAYFGAVETWNASIQQLKVQMRVH
eukprot:1324915-Rhodomonas_salina.1